MLLDFDHPDVACLASLVGCRYIDKPGAVARFRQAYDGMRRKTLTLEEWLR